MNKSFNWKLALLVTTIVVIIAYAIVSIFDYGRFRAGFDQFAENKHQQELEDKIERLEEQLADFRARTARLESAKKVDQHAKDAVKDILEQAEAESQELKEELEFYRTIVSPSKGRQGMHIHDFNLTQDQDGHYHYNLTATHIQGHRKHHRQSDGKITISVEGTQNGVVKKLDFANISTKKRSSIRYRFKYFSHFDGKINLPEGFKPQIIEIDIIPRQKTITGDSRKIKWPVVVQK